MAARGLVAPLEKDLVALGLLVDMNARSDERAIETPNMMRI